MPYSNDMPTPSEVLELISKMPEKLQKCRYKPCGGVHMSDQFVCDRCDRTWDHHDQVNHPDLCFTGDLWCEYLGVWLRLEDLSYCGDYARGRVYPNLWYRWRMQRALDRNESRIVQ